MTGRITRVQDERHCACGDTVTVIAGSLRTADDVIAAFNRLHTGVGHGPVTARQATAARRVRETDTMIGRRYLDPGSTLSGRHDPPVPVTVLTRWGPDRGDRDRGQLVRWHGPAPRFGPHNVLIERVDGTRDVVPFPRRLRRAER